MKYTFHCWNISVLLIITLAGSADLVSVSETNEDASKPDHSTQSSYNRNSRSESRHGKVTTGSYRVPLPDGRVQVVSYRADENGYVADVQYEGVAKKLEPKPASSYKAASFKYETMPQLVYEGLPARADVYPIQNHYEASIITALPTTTRRIFQYKDHIRSPYRSPFYMDPEHKAPSMTVANVGSTTSIPTNHRIPTPVVAVRYDSKQKTEASHSQHNMNNGPTDDLSLASPHSLASPYSPYSPVYKVPAAPSYGLKYLGGLQSNKGEDTRVYAHPIRNYEPTPVSNDGLNIFPVNSGYTAPVPLVFRAFYSPKASEIVNFNQDKDHRIYKNETPNFNTPKLKANSTYFRESSLYEAVTTARPKSGSSKPAYSIPDASTGTASKYKDPTTSVLAYVAPHYSSPTNSAPEQRSPPPAYKTKTYFNHNKDRVSPGYKELSRIFRETSLAAGNKNWDNFFNKAWEFSRTKY